MTSDISKKKKSKKQELQELAELLPPPPVLQRRTTCNLSSGDAATRCNPRCNPPNRRYKYRETQKD